MDIIGLRDKLNRFIEEGYGNVKVIENSNYKDEATELDLGYITKHYNKHFIKYEYEFHYSDSYKYYKESDDYEFVERALIIY